MLEEYAIPSADRSLSVAPWIPCKTDSRSRIEQVTLHATDWHAICNTAPNHSIRQVGKRNGLSGISPKSRYSPVRVDGCLAEDIATRIEIECLLLLFTVSAEQAQTESQIECKARSDVPVVLEVGFDDLISVVVLDELVLLPKT